MYLVILLLRKHVVWSPCLLVSSGVSTCVSSIKPPVLLYWLWWYCKNGREGENMLWGKHWWDYWQWLRRDNDNAYNTENTNNANIADNADNTERQTMETMQTIFRTCTKQTSWTKMNQLGSFCKQQPACRHNNLYRSDPKVAIYILAGGSYGPIPRHGPTPQTEPTWPLAPWHIIVSVMLIQFWPFLIGNGAKKTWYSTKHHLGNSMVFFGKPS